MKMTKQILEYVIIGGLFLVPFIPFIVPSAMFFPFITGKGFAFRILVEILFGAYVVLATIAPEYRPKMSWITKSIGVFALVILVADLCGANVYKSIWSNYERMEGFVLIAHLVLYYIVASSVLKSVKKWYQFFDISIVGSVVMAGYGILQLMGKAQINQGGVRLDATFGNSSYLAIYLVFHIFLCLYMYVARASEGWRKWAYGIVALLETWVLYFTATRGAILGLIGGLLLAGAIIAWKEKENKTLRKYSQILLGVILVVVVGFIAIRNTSFVQKSPVLSRFATLSFEEVKTQGRYYVWPMAVKGFVEHPILGWGQENFNFVFNKNYNPQMFGQEQWFDRTHNIVLDWLIAGGLLGLLSYAGMFVALLYYVWRKKSVLNLVEKSLLTGMVSAYIFHNMFVFDNLVSYILFFSVLGFVHVLTVERKEVAGKFYTHHVSSDVALYAIMPIVAVLTIGLVYYINVPALMANQTLISAITPQEGGAVDKNLEYFKQVYDYNSFGSTEATEQLVQITAGPLSAAQIPDALKKQFYDLAKEKIVEKVAQAPHDARYLVFAGSFFNHFAQYDEAIKYLDRAVAESPSKQTIYFELGTSYVGKGEYQKAFDTFKKAYDLEPSAPESQIIYAIGALYTKNTAVLQEMAPKISPDTVINDNRFLNAYATIGDMPMVINILSARVAKDPSNLQYKLSLASAYAQYHEKQKAIDLINEIIKLEPRFKDQGETYIKQIQNS